MRYGEPITDKTAAETRSDFRDMFRKWDISPDHYEIMPPEDRSTQSPATVVFWKNGNKQVLTCKRFSEYRVNLRALYRALDSTRLADQRGILPELAAAAAFLPPGRPQRRPAHEVLGIYPDATIEEAKAMYTVKAHKLHPDKGGDAAAMAELNEAFEEFKNQAA